MNEPVLSRAFINTLDKLVQLSIVLFSLYLGFETGFNKHISGEEGVVLDCVRFEFWRLLLPKDLYVQGCTIDHMPLYHLLAKGVFTLFGYDVIPFRALSVLISCVTGLFLYNWINRTKSIQSVLLAAVIVYFYFSASFTIQHFTFIRMYSLYALTALLSFIYFEKYLESKDDRSLLILCFVNFLGFANYAVHILLSISQFYYVRNVIPSDQQKRGYKVFLYIMSLYAIIKSVPLIQWRVLERSKDVAVRLDLQHIIEDFLLTWSGERAENAAFYIFLTILIASITITLLNRKRTKLVNYHLCLLAGTLVLAFGLRYGLNLREVSFRYFLYIGFIPLLLIRELASRKAYYYLFLSLFLTVSFNRGLELKINIWKNAQLELKQLIEFTKPITEVLNRDGFATDSFTYFNYYIKAVHDYELKRPLNEAELLFDENFDEHEVKWYFLFHSKNIDSFVSSTKTPLKILEKYKFSTAFDDHKYVIILKAEPYPVGQKK